MNLTITPVITILVVLCTLNSFPQENWSYSDCLKYALDNNIRIKQQSLNVMAMENSVSRAKSNILPSFNGALSNSFNYGRSLTYDNTYKDVNSTQLEGYLVTDITLWNGFILSNDIKKSKLDLQAALQEQLRIKNEIILNITASYLEILFAEEILMIAEEQLELTNRQLRRTKKLVEAGSLAAGAVLEAEARLAGDTLQLVKEVNRIKMAYMNLFQLLELPADKNFRIIHPELPEIKTKKMPQNSNEILKKALNKRPEIKASEIRIESAKRQLDIARGNRYPGLSFGADYLNIYNNKYTGMYNNHINLSDQLSNNKRYTMGFKLNIPLFNKFRVKYEIFDASIKVQTCEYQLENTRNILKKEIMQAWNNANAALNRYLAGKKAVTAAEEAFRYAEEKLNAGLISSMDYYQSKNYLTTVRSELVQSKYEYIFRSKILDFYRGIPIEL
ncbi:MAG: TolC family protein [Prolixibacteraceae bacterium]|nr:TolC family protein [Prolixibacteraceae bacterium]